MNKSWKDCSGKILGSKNGFDAIQCDKCKFIHVIPLPSEVEIDKYYKDTFYSSYKPDYMEKHKKDLEWWNRLYQERLTRFEENIDKNHIPSILDVGSGPGFFLKFFNDNGWNVLGLEPGKSAADFSRLLGVDVIEDSVYNVSKLNLNSFDVIYSNQTFEHLIYPDKAILELRQVLKPGGLFSITVANDFNPFQLLAVEQLDLEQWWLIPPEHVNYFNKVSINDLVSRNGFEVIYENVSFPIDIFLLMGDNYVDNPSIGRKAHNRRKMLENNLISSGNEDMKNELYNGFMQLGLGREIEILAKKI